MERKEKKKKYEKKHSNWLLDPKVVARSPFPLPDSDSGVSSARNPPRSGPLINRGTGRLRGHVAVINMRLQISLVFGAKRAMGAIEGGRLAALVQQMPLQYVSVLVTLPASRAIVATVESRNGHAADRSVIIVVVVVVVVVVVIVVVVPPTVTGGAMKSRPPLRRQRCWNFIGCDA